MTGSDTKHASKSISVIIPCFNAARYIGEAIESVLTQTLSSHEIIVIDDGSTDDSAKVIAGFNQHVRYIHQENQGISAARNRGIAEVSGDFIAFLDADDLWPNDSLKTRWNCLSTSPEIDYAYGWVEPFLSPDVSPEAGRTLGAVVEARPGRLAGSLLLRRKVVAAVGNFDSKFQIGETMDWVARIDAAGFSSRDVGGIVLRRRVHGANTVIKERKMQSDYLRVLRAAIGRRQETTDQ